MSLVNHVRKIAEFASETMHMRSSVVESAQVLQLGSEFLKMAYRMSSALKILHLRCVSIYNFGFYQK